jgi:hypothetical protein
MEAMKWLCNGLLAMGLAVTLSACGGGGDDDDSAGGGTIHTNVVVVPGPGGTTMTNLVVVTNPPPNPPIVVPTNSPPADPDPVLRLMAPQLASPANGETFTTSVPSVLTSVKMEWTAVPGAATYVVEVDGTKYVTDGTSRTMGFAVGTHTWSVLARDGDDMEGWPSDTSSFTVRENLPMM